MARKRTDPPTSKRSRRSPQRRAIVTLRLSEEDREALEQLARTRGVPMMEVLRAGLEHELAEAS